MRKKAVTMLLVLCMVMTLLPSAVFATNIDEEKITYLGSEAEYKNTMDTYFDSNGLRKVTVGWNSNDGVVGKKIGLVDKYGNFVAQPIYDEIQLHADIPQLGQFGRTVLPTYFLGGYTQVKRDGKMGLMNTLGEEVIPCKYDFVGLPSEGMCRVLNKFGTADKRGRQKWYVGYWNLAQNREVVTPNKYIANDNNTRIGKNPGNGKETPAGYFLAYHDFIGGYAMVYTGGIENDYPMATVIDKNGKNIYGKSYMTNGFPYSYDAYSQKGPYMSFVVPKTLKNYRFQKLYEPDWVNTETFQTYATGLVGPKGIQIPPTWVTGVLAAAAESSFYVSPSQFEIILEKGLILTSKDAKPGYLYGSAYGVIDFNGKTVLPFNHGNNQELYYDADNQVFTTLTKVAYNMKGKMLHDPSYGYDFFENGYASVEHTGNFNKKTDTFDRTLYMSNTAGSLLNLSKLLNLPVNDHEMQKRVSKVSTSGLFWAKNAKGKWGLLNLSGKTILPFQYDDVSFGPWSTGTNGFAGVIQNGKEGMVNVQGKQVLPCAYKFISNTAANSWVVTVKDSNNKVGLVEVKTGKFIFPMGYDKFGAFRDFDQRDPTYFAMGIGYAEKDGKKLLIDRNGNEVFSTDKKFHEAIDGLYNFNDNSGKFDNRGRIVIPGSLGELENIECSASHTLFVKDGKFARISANYLPATYGYKKYVPTSVYASPSNTKVVVNGKNVAVDAYKIAGNNYIQIRDLAALVNGTEKNFEVSWNSGKGAIELMSQKPYTTVGGEFGKNDGKTKNAKRSLAPIYVDGNMVQMTAYYIGGHTYFKIGDVMQMFNISVGYDSVLKAAMVDTTKSYELGAYEAAKKEAANKACLDAGGNPYVEEPTYKEEFAQFRTVPDKILYKVGEPFEIAGFKVVWMDIYADGTDISGDIVLKIGGNIITDGYKFQEAGEKTVDCYYKDKKLNSFKISVVAEDSNLLADGAYTISVYGNYLRMIDASGSGWMELSDKKPAQKFTVKLIKVDAKRGPLYNIMTEDGRYVMQETTKNGAQLKTSNIPHQWRINQYSKFCTIRDYGNQKLIVNASGQQSKNGTKVIVWTDTGSADDNAKLKFTKVD